MNLKYILLLILLGFTTINIKAQQERPKRFEIGVSASANLDKFAGTVADNSIFSVGFAVGVTTEVAILKWLAVAPELKYVLKGSKIKESNERISLHYLEVPVALKFYVSKKLCFDAGIYAAYCLGEYSVNEAFTYQNIAKFDFGFLTGLTYNFDRKFAAFLRYNQGVVNIYPPDEKIFNTSIQAGINFKF